MAPPGILRTRLLPPRVPPDPVDRRRLVETLLRGLEGPVVTVVAGAGYGKTTLLAQAYEADERRWIWLSCDARIRDARSLLAHLAVGLSEYLPGLDARLELDETDPAALIDGLANELHETLTDDIVLALDDVHTLPDNAAAIVEQLATVLPPPAHLLLASREALPVPTSRLRAARGVALDESQLKLDEAESDRLLSSLGLALTPEASERIRGLTEGWAAGIVLAAQTGGDVKGAQTLSGEHFDYLAEEVLARQPPDLQRFVLGTAALSRFSPDLAAALTGLENCSALARNLVDQRLFTVRLEAGGDWYRYHHLFREFLRRRAEIEEPGALAEQHRRAAAWWRGQGEGAEAVRHDLAGGDTSAAVEALEPIAQAMAGTAEAETLSDWLRAIPRPLWENRPSLVLANARVLMAGARHEESFAESERAIEFLLESGEHEGAGGALVRLQQSMIAAGTRPTRRIEAGSRFVERVDQSVPLVNVARVLLATAYGYACRFDEARAQLDAVEGVEEDAVGLMAAAARCFYVDFWTDSPIRALARLRAAREGMEELGADPLAILPTTMALETYLVNELGFFEDAERLTARVEAVWTSAGLGRRALDRVESWVKGTWLAGMGRWKELELAMPPPPRSEQRRNASSYTYRYRVLAARLAAHRGDEPAVAAQTDACIKEMDAFEPVFDDASFLCDLVSSAHKVGSRSRAQELVVRAGERAVAVGSPWLRARHAIAAALVGDAAEEGRAIDRALQLTDEWSLDPLWTNREREWAPRLLGTAIERELGPEGTAERLLVAAGSGALAEALEVSTDPAARQRMASLAGRVPDLDLGFVDTLMRDEDGGVRKAARLSREALLGRPRAAIVIRSLGRLDVFRDGALLPPSAYPTQEARDLLARLLANGGAIPLGAGEDASATVVDLQRTLQPELETGDRASLVTLAGETVHLSLAYDDSWDVQRLRSLAELVGARDEERLNALLDAEELLDGDFLAEWRDEPWASSGRAEIRSLQGRLLGELGELLLSQSRPGDAAIRFRRLAARDPLDERALRGLMASLADSENRALALGEFQSFQARLRRERGCDPGPATQDLYAEILLLDQALAGTQHHGTVTIVFTDIEGSTVMAERLGDRRWAGVVRAHDQLASREAAVRGGRLIKSQGDGVMLAFPFARSAIDFAIGFQRRVEGDFPIADAEGLRVRVGLHTGEAVAEGDDYLGRAVIVASRIAEACPAGGILISAVARELVAGGDVDERIDDGFETELKGIKGAQRLHGVEWRDRVARPAS